MPATRQPTIETVLKDPMIRQVMRADGVSATEMRALLENAARALRAGNVPNGGRVLRSALRPRPAEARPEAR